MKKLLLAGLLIAVVWYLYAENRTVTLGPGVKAPDAPVQRRVERQRFFQKGDYTVTTLADFRVRAKVLSKENYHLGRQSELSPVDLALGWGRMSDEAVLDDIDIWQSGRWYLWRVKQYPIPRREIETHSANMHLVPVDERVKSQLKRVREGEIVEFEGKLIRADAGDGWQWMSSLTRDDVGDGACELVLVENFRVLESG